MSQTSTLRTPTAVIYRDANIRVIPSLTILALLDRAREQAPPKQPAPVPQAARE